jgi:hypothetical protein
MNCTKSGLHGLAFTLALVATGASAADETAPAYSNKWRVEVSEGSASDGTIQFRVTPKGGTPTDVSVTIIKGRGENAVARDIRDAMRSSLDSKVFHVEVDDGEDVLVKKKSGPDFALELVQTTVMATRLDIEKE